MAHCPRCSLFGLVILAGCLGGEAPLTDLSPPSPPESSGVDEGESTGSVPESAAGPSRPEPAAPTEERVEKERSDVPEPAAVSWQRVRYEAVLWGKARGLEQNGGYLAAFDEPSGCEKWILKVYTVSYDDGRESDKQDVFITRLALHADGRELQVENERGETYFVNLSDRSVRGPDRKQD